MTQTGRAKGQGPHRVPRITQARGKPKSEEWCGKPAGLHGPLLLGCGQGLALQGSSANEGRFRQFMPELSKTQDSSALVACQPRPGSAARRMRAPPSPAPPAPPGGNVRMWCADPSSIRRHRRRPWHRTCESQCVRGPRSRTLQWTLSARVWRDLGRSDSHRHQRRPPRRWPASAHRDRSRAARSSRGPATAAGPAPPARPRPHDNRYPSVGRSAVMALGTVGQFGGIDVGNAYLLAAAADGVAVVDGWRKTQDGSGKKDGHARKPSAPCPSRQWPRSSPAGPASMPASLGGRRCNSADARPSE